MSDEPDAIHNVVELFPAETTILPIPVTVAVKILVGLARRAPRRYILVRFLLHSLGDLQSTSNAVLLDHLAHRWVFHDASSRRTHESHS